MKYCQGPSCHEYKTKDRIRGPKGAKYYATRRRTHLNYGNEWCSMQCYNDWLNKFGTRAIDHFGRIHEPKRVGCDSAWYKDYKYRYGGLADQHYFVNDLLGRRILITQQQYQDDNFTSPN